jgi:hypothetical protein
MTKSRDWFCLAVRLVGLFFFAYFVVDTLYVIAKVTCIPVVSRQPLSADAFAAVFNFIVAMGLMFGAEVFTRLIYGADNPDSTA